MKVDIAKVLQKRKKQIIEDWMNLQLADASLREDLMSNEELREQSNELVDVLLKEMNDRNLADVDSPDFEPVHEVLSGISISRARQGFSPKETGLYVFSLKDALLNNLQAELKSDPVALVEALLKIDKLMDALGLVTFETFIKGREEVILRQTSEITEISTPVIRVWDGILALPIIGTLDSARTGCDGEPAPGNCNERKYYCHTRYFRSSCG